MVQRIFGARVASGWCSQQRQHRQSFHLWRTSDMKGNSSSAIARTAVRGTCLNHGPWEAWSPKDEVPRRCPLSGQDLAGYPIISRMQDRSAEGIAEGISRFPKHSLKCASRRNPAGVGLATEPLAEPHVGFTRPHHVAQPNGLRLALECHSPRPAGTNLKVAAVGKCLNNPYQMMLE